MKSPRGQARGSQLPAFTPLSAGTCELSLRRYGVERSGSFILSLDPYGSNRSVSTVSTQAPDLSETSP